MSLSPEQLAARKHFIGASEVPCILGISPFGSKHSVWVSKCLDEPDEQTDAMKAGNYLEPGIAQWYADETKRHVASWFGSMVHKDYPWMGATPDLCVNGERRIVQIKFVGTFMAHHWEDGVPEYVEAQVQAEMEVCDAEWCDVAALIGGTDFRILPIQRDRAIGAGLVQICGDFWHNHVLPREMPDVDGSEHARRMVHALYKKATLATMLASPESDALALAWLESFDRLKAATTEREELSSRLKVMLGESEGIDGAAYKVRWANKADGSRGPFSVKERNMKVRSI